MCEFLSWITYNEVVLHLDSATLEETRTKKLFREGCKDNDLLGHGAIRAVYDLQLGQGKEGELQNFWLTNQLPKVIQKKLHDFESFKNNFGRMVTNNAQVDDLEYIIENSPEDEPKNKHWKGLRAYAKQILMDHSEKHIQELLASATQQEFDLTIDYDSNLKDLVTKGKYGYVDSDINSKNFPQPKDRKGKVNRKAILVCLRDDASTHEVEAVLAQLNLVSGNLQELLSFGATYPDEQRKYLIAAFGSSWCGSGGYACVPGLWHGFVGDGRGLYLGGRDRRWYSRCCFLVFCK